MPKQIGRIFKSFRLGIYLLTFAIIVGWIVLSPTLLSKPGTFETPTPPDDTPDSVSAMPALPRKITAGLLLGESMTLTKDLHFAKAHYDALIQTNAPDITLDCKGHKIFGNANFGILVNEGSNIEIRNCYVIGPFQGFFVNASVGVKISNSTFSVAMNAGHIATSSRIELDKILFEPMSPPSKGYALEVTNSNDVAVTHSTTSGFDQGLLLYGTENFRIESNRLSDINETAIGTFQFKMGSPTGHGSIKNNIISNAQMGLEIHTGSHDLLIEQNEISRCKAALRMDDEHGTDRFAPLFNIRFSKNVFKDNAERTQIMVRDKRSISGIDLQQ
jgi:nitrous oxidase accessory protein NosD